jgi:hypothetical protein
LLLLLLVVLLVLLLMLLLLLLLLLLCAFLHLWLVVRLVAAPNLCHLLSCASRVLLPGRGSVWLLLLLLMLLLVIRQWQQRRRGLLLLARNHPEALWVNWPIPKQLLVWLCCSVQL